MRWWSELSQVDRVDLYTRQSLYGFLWLSAVFVFFNAAEVGREQPSAYALLALGIVVTTAIATRVMHDVFELYPAQGPMPWRSIGAFLAAGAALLTIGVASTTEARGLATMSVFAAAAWSLGGLRSPSASAALVLGLTVLAGATTQDLAIAVGGALMALFLVFTVRVSLWLLGVVTELDRARTAQAALAVAEERLRFSRDVHDVLGRRLSTIAVQAELAATLTERGDPGAGERMLAVRTVAHEALREARELARGYRPTDLAQELDGARSLLRSAGIEVMLEVRDLPAPWQEPAAWVVREAVTNVLRHSAATQVTISYDDGELSVGNDGVVASASAGSGIAGLRERLAPLGATLSTSIDGDRFRLTAHFPEHALEPA